MGFRFRKGLRLFPGLRLNIFKSGFSLSIGKAPFTINLGKKGAMTTTSLPGSGMSYRSKRRRLW
jgi:hypothetical protein